MFDYLMIRYGEIGTKGKNKKLFIKYLLNNIKERLKPFSESKIYNRYDRIYISIDKENKDKIVAILKNIPGIQSFSFVYYAKDLDELLNKTLILANKRKEKSFKIETRRGDKTFFLRSLEVTKKVANNILDNKDVKVDVHNPGFIINIEIRKEGIYFYIGKEKGLGGYPVGSLGKALLLLSGGIDSPVSAFQMIRRGVEIEVIHFTSPPYTSIQSEQKVFDLVKELQKFQPRIRLHKINFTKIQQQIYKHSDESYYISILRRMMYRVSERIAKTRKIKALSNGDSIGQVASQTIESLENISRVIKIPLFRPLVVMDKMDIIKISKAINTYQISIRPYDDCCNIFKPKEPVIRPKEYICKEIEEKINVEELVKESIREKKDMFFKEEEI